MAEEFVGFVKANGIKPVVAEVFGFEEVKRGLEVLEKQRSVGKLVVRVESSEVTVKR